MTEINELLINSSTLDETTEAGTTPVVYTTTFTGVTTQEPAHSQDLLVGCALAISGNLLISVSLNLQKYSHTKNAALETQRHYTKDPLWWLGLALMGLGEVGNFSAYGFAPASLVAPLGTTTVVANMFLAVLFLKEKLRPEDLFGCALAIVGAFLIVNFSSKKEQVADADEITALLLQPAFLVYISLEIVMLVVLFVLKYKFDIDNVLVLLLITAILASFTVIGAKAVSSMLQITLAGTMQLNKPVFYAMLVVMAVTLVAQIKYLNLAMKGYNSTVVVPTNFVFFTISAILAGIVFYRELWGVEALDVFMFLFGCVMSFIGVYFITSGRLSGDDDDADTDRRAIKIVPTWLLSKVNKSEVQPRRGSDTQPILSAENQISDDSSSSYSNTDFTALQLTKAEVTKSPEIAKKSYGTSEP